MYIKKIFFFKGVLKFRIKDIKLILITISYVYVYRKIFVKRVVLRALAKASA